MQSVQRELTTFVAHGGLPRPLLAGRFDLLFARLAYGAARSFGWSRCGAHLLACANRMAPLHGERGAQDVAIELFAALGRASRRWPAAERVPARVQLSAFLRQHCILGGSGDGVDVGVEVAAAVRFVATRVDARRAAWLAEALRLDWLGDAAHAPAVGNASAQARALDLAAGLAQLLDWRGGAWCARVCAMVQRGCTDAQPLLRYSQLRASTARLIGALLHVSARDGGGLAQACGALVRSVVECAASQSDALELLLLVVLADAAQAPAFADELPRVVLTALDGQRDNDPERASLARHAAALLMQYTLSVAQVDALLAALRALLTSGDAGAWQAWRVALPMLQLLALRNPLRRRASRCAGAPRA